MFTKARVHRRCVGHPVLMGFVSSDTDCAQLCDQQPSSCLAFNRNSKGAFSALLGCYCS